MELPPSRKKNRQPSRGEMQQQELLSFDEPPGEEVLLKEDERWSAVSKMSVEAAVEEAFAEPVEAEISARRITGPEPSPEETAQWMEEAKKAPDARLDEPMPSRMMNEFVYCPRLFYYEYVEGVFVENADTERGSALHAKIDKGKGDLPAAKVIREEDETEDDPKPRKRKKRKIEEDGELRMEDGEGEGPSGTGSGNGTVEETIHSRSADMSSDRLRVRAKMDLIEARVERDGDGEKLVLSVTPVDYKAGAPREGKEGNELWDPDKMQLGLQILILRDNGYRCTDGVIYYRATRQRVRLEMTAELEEWIIREIARARETARGAMPPPLVGSPKCVRCSLAPVCLPDETFLMVETANEGVPPTRAPRRLMAARDEARALYLNTPGLKVTRRDEVLVVKDTDRVLEEVRAGDLTHVALFGNIQITTQAIQMLCDLEIPVAYFSMGGWFYGLTRGHGMTNVFSRIHQFRTAADPLRCLVLARQFVHGKIKNHRTLLMRSHLEPPAPALARLKQAAQDVLAARDLPELLGMEGAAAAVYFQHFGGMLKSGTAEDDALPGLEDTGRPPEPPVFTFDFTRRTRRPPTDPVNALLSLSYSLLAKDCTIAALAVGLDPYVGFYHQPRFGRPALALDLMEEFRPLVAESTVLTTVNNRMLNLGHFVKAGDSVNLTKAGRRIFFQAYEQRMNALINHPVFGYRVSYRRVLELQARILSGYLTGEIPEYKPMVTR